MKKVKYGRVAVRLVILFVIILLAVKAIFMIFNMIFVSLIPIDSNNDRKHEVAMVFELSRNMNADIKYADAIFFQNIIKTFREHKGIKVNIRVNGALLRGLNWYSQDTIKMIKEGIAEGQFEIMGGTYSDNMMLQGIENINEWQLEEDKAAIKDILGLEPKAFYSNSSVEEFFSMLSKNGYNILVYDYETNKRVKQSPTLYFSPDQKNRILIGNKELKLLTHESIQKEKQFKKLLAFLYSNYKKDKNNKYIETIVFNENFDIFKVGEKKYRDNISNKIEDISKFLSNLEKYKWINTIKLSDIGKSKEINENRKIEKNTVAEMVKMYNEEINTNPKLLIDAENDNKNIGFRNGYFLLRRMDGKIGEYDKAFDPVIKRMERNARLSIINTMYHFPEEIQINKKTKIDSVQNKSINSVKNTNVIIDVIKNRLTYIEAIREEDVNLDGKKELVVVNNNNYYLFSTENGGRLLYWYNLSAGIEIVGNELAFPANYNSDSDDNVSPTIYDEKTYLGVLGLNGDKLANNSDKQFVRIRALNDWFYKGNSMESFENKKLSYNIIQPKKSIEFSSADYKKRVTFDETGFTVEYELNTNESGFEVVSEVQPDYYTVVDKGIESLSLSNSKGETEIKNNFSKIRLTLNYPVSATINEYNGMFAKVIGIKTNEKQLTIKFTLKD